MNSTDFYRHHFALHGDAWWWLWRAAVWCDVCRPVYSPARKVCTLVD